MSKIQFKDFPKEILDKIKEITESRGKTFNIAALNEYYTRQTSISVDLAFRYNDTEEDFSFWEAVINQQDFNVFFKRYPKQESSFEDKAYPDETPGTKYLVVTGDNAGETVTLKDNDNSPAPAFYIGDGWIYISWRRLKRINPLISPTEIVLGEKFEDKAYPNEVVGTKYYYHSDGFKHGKIFELRKNDGSCNPYFWNADRSDYECIYWYRLQRIDEKLVESINVNNNYETDSTTDVVFAVSATITVRPAPRGVELQSPRSKILLGN